MRCPRGRSGTLSCSTPMENRHVAIGRDRVDAVGHHRHLVSRLDHRHGSGALQDFGENADVVRIKVRHQHEGHAAVGRNIAEELLECFEAACGSAQADDGEACAVRPLWFRCGLRGKFRDRFPDNLRSFASIFLRLVLFGYHEVSFACDWYDSGRRILQLVQGGLRKTPCRSTQIVSHNPWLRCRYLAKQKGRASQASV